MFILSICSPIYKKINKVNPWNCFEHTSQAKRTETRNWYLCLACYRVPRMNGSQFSCCLTASQIVYTLDVGALRVKPELNCKTSYILSTFSDFKAPLSSFIIGSLSVATKTRFALVFFTIFFTFLRISFFGGKHMS